jgi:ribosome-associated protein
MEDCLEPISGLRIPIREITFRATRSGGPGGQHANVTESRIDASFDVRSSPSLREDQRAMLLARAGAVIRAGAQDERSQLRNRQLALERLERRLAAALRPARPRARTRTPARVERQRLEAKRRRSAAKRSRRPPERED